MYPCWEKKGDITQYKLDAEKKEIGWQQIDNKWYFFDEKGKMLTDIWLNDNNNWYYFSDSGEMIKDEWKQYNNDWFYCNNDGKMLNSVWIKFGDNWFFLDETGKMVIMKRISNNPYKIEYGYWDDIHQIANIEKKIPLEWIDQENNQVKQELIDYMRPLIQGEVKQIYKDGIPQHLIRK